ncbi:MAG: hypothetical protein GX595_07805 [Lentisphaerae bacterium]|nr:hypothetical protein [Lentisphaerota bacterium]
MATVYRDPIYRAVTSLFLAGAVLTSAVEIAVYDFLNNDGTGTLTARDTADNLTASDLGRGSGITAFARTSSFAAYGWTTGASPDANDYVEFTLTPAWGYSLSLDALTFGEQQVDLDTPWLSTTAYDARNWAVRSSLDNYTANLDYGSTTAPGSGAGTHSIDLSGLGTLTSAVTFRIYGYNASDSFFLGLLRNPQPEFNDWALVNYETGRGVTVTGEVTLIPEPGAGLFLALGGAALLCRRRPRRRARGSAATAATPAAA